MDSYLRSIFVRCVLVVGLLAPILHGYAGQLTQDGAASWTQKVPDGVIQKLSQGGAQDLIVRFEDTAVEQEAENLRRRLGLKIQSPAVQTLKAGRYKTLKQNAISSLGSGQFQVLLDYSHLPMMFVRFRTAAGLQAFLQRSDVVAVYRDEKKIPVLAESLPLINQPAVVSAGPKATTVT